MNLKINKIMAEITQIKIMEYSVVKENNINELQEKVNSLIERGWIPQGGIGVSSSYGYYVQAMIKTI
jgi:hypothetical protein